MDKNFDKIIPVYKPRGISTFDLIRYFKKETNFKGKIGHGGTLDPMAFGLILLLFGKETKKFETIKNLPKTYIAGIYFGVFSDTYDMAGSLKTKKCQKPAKQDIKKAVLNFKSEYFQKIPPFSAAKHKGKPLYKLARQGIEIEKEKKVKLNKVEIIYFNWPVLFLKVKASGGFYVRQFVQDIAKKINCSGVLFYLKRTQIGNYSLKNALTIKELINNFVD